MLPNYEAAAAAAMNLLIRKNITATPIDSLSILLSTPGVRVMTFSEMATETGENRDELVPLFGTNQDAVTFKLPQAFDGVDYVVIYNRFLSVDIVSRGIARELGHIVMGHDGQTRPADVRMAEALCFSHHLLSPRPVIRLLQESGLRITLDILAETTGCSSDCVKGLQAIPGVHVPKEINRMVKEQFAQEIMEYVRFRSASNKTDTSQIIDFGSFMDNYED